MHTKIFKWIVLSALLFLQPAQSAAWGRVSVDTNVRVAIYKSIKNISLSVKGKFQVLDMMTNKRFKDISSLKNAYVYGVKSGIKIGSSVISSTKVKVVLKSGTIFVNKRRFRGSISIIKNKDGLLTIVNDLNVEQYVKGVLVNEASHKWPLEVLKAQAVASRTYALYHMTYTKDKDYDVTNDIYSQVYGGKSTERFKCNIAVNHTKGQVLTYKNKMFPTYFHATCAGNTEDADQLWNINLPVLKGRSCPYCKKSPHYYWKRNIRLKDVQDKLNENGHDLWLIKDVSIVSRNKSGRIKELKIITRNGNEAVVSGKDFRNIVGPNYIRSNNYEIVMKGYYMDVIGKGWGHGVGMCQWGAFFMSKDRKKYKDILTYYYPGSEVKQYRDTLNSKDNAKK